MRENRDVYSNAYQRPQCAVSVYPVGDKYATAGERTTERAVPNTWPAFQFFSYIHVYNV